MLERDHLPGLTADCRSLFYPRVTPGFEMHADLEETPRFSINASYEDDELRVRRALASPAARRRLVEALEGFLDRWALEDAA